MNQVKSLKVQKKIETPLSALYINHQLEALTIIYS